ncbi:unnamed protein product [Gongylonema pulchrum]|uniref:PPM-type phosphatase domain-containing protein n=1 Tax=Gongylonema pulchrum TaxID=637853 RepID=A0A183DKF1_9BILA|nr:unnamed protein product [Gongylonema pulchrum]
MVVRIQGELRVNGVLNLTRDIDGRPMISPEPDIISFELDNSEYLLLLACDGVWDSLTEREVFSHVAEFVRANPPESENRLIFFLETLPPFRTCFLLARHSLKFHIY